MKLPEKLNVVFWLVIVPLLLVFAGVIYAARDYVRLLEGIL